MATKNVVVNREGQTGADKGRDNQSNRDRDGQKRDGRVRQGLMWAVSDRG